MRQHSILYHGSPRDLDILIPSPLLYASHKLEFALPFCLTVEKENIISSWNLHLDDKELSLELDDSHLNTDVGGWIYVIDSNSFVKINEYEWVSHTSVNFLKKIKVSSTMIKKIWGQ